jgi:hypothetical protein
LFFFFFCFFHFSLFQEVKRHVDELSDMVADLKDDQLIEAEQQHTFDVLSKSMIRSDC